MTVEENLRLGAFVRRDRAAVARGLERVYAYFPILKERRRQLSGDALRRAVADGVHRPRSDVGAEDDAARRAERRAGAAGRARHLPHHPPHLRAAA